MVTRTPSATTSFDSSEEEGDSPPVSIDTLFCLLKLDVMDATGLDVTETQIGEPRGVMTSLAEIERATPMALGRLAMA